MQIPWSDEYQHRTARVLFGSNLLALTWIKGEAMPDGLVDDILRALSLERQTRPEQQQVEENLQMIESLETGPTTAQSAPMSAHTADDAGSPAGVPEHKDDPSHALDDYDDIAASSLSAMPRTRSTSLHSHLTASRTRARFNTI